MTSLLALPTICSAAVVALSFLGVRPIIVACATPGRDRLLLGAGMTNADLLNGFAAAISAAMATAYIILTVPAVRPLISRVWRS